MTGIGVLGRFGMLPNREADCIPCSWQQLGLVAEIGFFGLDSVLHLESENWRWEHRVFSGAESVVAGDPSLTLC